MSPEPLPYKTPLEVKVDTPVPPYATPISVDCQVPVAIVPRVVSEVCPT